MAKTSEAQQFVLLPPRGVRAQSFSASNELTAFLTAFPSGGVSRAVAASRSSGTPGTPRMRVLDSIGENGAKLVEMTPNAVSDLRANQPGLRIVPVVFFTPAIAPRPVPFSRPTPSKAAVAVRSQITIVSGANKSPVAGASVVAFTDFANRVGASGTTNAQGVVRLTLGSGRPKIQRLYVYPGLGFWPAMKKNFTLGAPLDVALAPIDLGQDDPLRHFYNAADITDGRGVTVGVVDTGIASHPNLTIAGGENTVTGEAPKAFGDNGDGHGTHVAGIIAAHGTPPTGVRGVAPGVTLRSYRVFGQNSDQASNFAISKAVDRAVADGCDLINMSLGGGDADEATRSAISDARAHGSVVIVAAGNDDRSPVSFPASLDMSLAVSAMGRKGLYPRGTVESGSVTGPYGTDPHDFIADFSNIGPEIDLTAPGVGIVSTFPGGYAVLDGTSMACPAATGRGAKLLAQNAAILAMSRDAARSDAIARMILQAAKPRGFGVNYEGQGML